MLPQRFLICPHCMTENPAFGAQRCVSCGLNMMSDQLQAIREQKVKPLSQKLDEQMLQIRAGQDQQAAVNYTRELYKGLQTYKQQAEFSFLENQLEEASTALEPFPEKKEQNKRSITTWIVLLILFLFPIGAFIIYQSAFLTILLSITFFAWLVVAVIPEMKQQAERQREYNK